MNSNEEPTLAMASAFDYEAAGAITVTSPESPIFSAGISNSQEFSWRVSGFVETQLESSWQVGDGDYYWYRVEGECTPVECETMGVQYDNCRRMTFTTVVAGRNIAEVCENMKNPIVNAPVLTRITTIKRYSRPVIRTGPNNFDCNILEDEYFCQVPECQDYCVHENVSINIPIRFFVFDTIYSVTMSGGISLSGRSEGDFRFDFIPYYPVVYFGGGHEVVVRYSYGPGQFGALSFVEAASTQQVEMGGSAEFSSSRYDFESSGSIVLSGHSENVSPSWNYSPLIPTMSSAINEVILTETGQELLAEDGTQIQASSLLYFAEGIHLGGGLSSLGYTIIGSGAFEIQGAADVLLSLIYEPDYSDSILMGGSVTDLSSPSYQYSPSSGVYISGDADLGFEDLGVILVNIRMAASVFGLGYEYESDNISPSSLTISNSVVQNSCGCSFVGLSLVLTHNLINSSVLSKFFLRNGLTLPEKFNLGYKSYDNSWKHTQKFSGISGDGLPEQMSIFFSLSCMSEYWRFSFTARSQDQNNFLETKLIMDMPSSFVCTTNGNISTDILVDINSGEITAVADEKFFVVTPHSIRPAPKEPVRGLDVTVGGEANGYAIYYDDIGLFKNSYWDRVSLKFGLNPVSKMEMVTMDLQELL